MYKIIFIDEESDSLQDFERYIKKGKKIGFDFEVKAVHPLDNIDDTLQMIIEYSPDILITDFQLNAIKEDIEYIVPFNGAELVDAFQKIRTGFPCFIMTACDDDAIEQTEDVNIVYVKNILHKQEQSNDNEPKVGFLGRVKAQIDHYRTRIAKSEKELLELLELKKTGNASAQQEAEILKLDSFLEQSVDGRVAIPEELKKSSNDDRLVSILNKVDELLNKINNP
jgi:DNA-binding NarL/FixJ family response regulator